MNNTYQLPTSRRVGVLAVVSGDETAGHGQDGTSGAGNAVDARGYARAFLTEQYGQPVTQAVAESAALAYLLAACSAGNDGYTLAVLAGLADAYHEQRGW